MINILSGKLINYLDKNQFLKEDKEIYIYGAKIFISTFIGTSILLVAGLVTNRFIEAIIYEIIISSSRIIMGGYHAKSYTMCITVYVGIFVIGTIVINYHDFKLIEIVIFCIVSLVTTYLLSPVENVNKKISKKKNQKFKKISIIYIVVYILIIFILDCIKCYYLSIFVWCLISINILTIGGRLSYE